MAGVKYRITVDAYDVENVRKALQFIASEPRCLEKGLHGDGGGLGGEPWKWQIERSEMASVPVFLPLHDTE